MEFIDGEGRIFGLVNIIDALVVLLVLAVVVAGAALVLSDEPEASPDLATTYATLDLGTPPDYIAAVINEGDTSSPGGNSKLTITDVYVSPQGDQKHILVRVELQGKAGGEYVQYDGAPPRLGRKLKITTDLYQVSGNIRTVGDSSSLQKEATPVVIRDTIPVQDAKSIAPGDSITVAGRTVASVDDVAVYPTSDPDKTNVYLETTLNARRQLGELRFGGSPIRQGQSVTLPAKAYSINGQIASVGSGLSTDSADVLLTQTVDASTAQRMSEGDVATVADHEVGVVESVVTYGTNDPDQKRVFMGVSLETLNFGGREYFGPIHLQRGTDLPISTAKYDVVGRVARVGTLTQPGNEATRTVRIQLTDVPKEMVASLRPGMVERSGGTTVARVTNVSAQPSIVLIRGEDGKLGVYDHPIQRRVLITADLQVRQTANGIRFKGETIQQGSTITLDLGTTTISGTVVSIE